MLDRRRWTASPVLAFALSLCAGASALAQTHHVSGYAFEDHAWVFKPVYRDGVSPTRVDAFVAIAKADVAIGDNIVVVSYTRGATDSDPWTAKSWTTTDRVTGVKYAKASLDIPDSEDALWGIDAPIGSLPPEMIEPAKDYDKGLLVEDPLYWWLVADPDRSVIIEMLAGWGLKVADIAIEKDGGACSPSEKLTYMANAAEWGQGQTITDDASGTYVASHMADMVYPVAFCQPTAPPPAPPPPPTPPCTVGPVTPPGWVVTPWVIRAIPTTWTSDGGLLTPSPGGMSGTCNYSACATYAQFKSCTWMRANCTTYTCTQVQTGTACATLPCPITIPIPGPYVCPASPMPWCTTGTPTILAFPAAPTTIIAPWGPPCF